MTVPEQPDRYRTWDAAYVLGALAPAEQEEYEHHLAGCPDCQRAVSEVADVPELLALGDRAGSAPPAGPEVLQVGSASRRSRHSRVSRLAWVGVVAAALAVVVGVIGLAGLRGAPPLGTPGPYRVAFEPVTPNAITAVVDVVPHDGGTTFKVECQYGSDSERPYAKAHGDYAIYVVDRAGNSTLAKTWYARPDRQMRPTAESPLPVRRIEAVEIWDDRRRPLLRATLR